MICEHAYSQTNTHSLTHSLTRSLTHPLTEGHQYYNKTAKPFNKTRVYLINFSRPEKFHRQRGTLQSHPLFGQTMAVDTYYYYLLIEFFCDTNGP